MRKPLTALAAAGALGLALVSTTQPAHAIDPWTAAAWFVGGMFVGGAIVAPAYGYPYRTGYAYAAPYPHCHPATIRQRGQWRNVRICY